MRNSRLVGLWSIAIVAILFGALALFRLQIAMLVPPLERMRSPEKLTLFSIDGTERWRRGKISASEYFRGYPILGKIEIEGAEQRQRLISALKQAVATSSGKPDCFWPRHALKVTENGATTEYVICFQCGQVEEYGAWNSWNRAISADFQPVFDAPLKAAGVPIAR
jgi:hypothetical protein